MSMLRFLTVGLCGMLLVSACLRQSGAGESAVQEQTTNGGEAARPGIPQDAGAAVRRETPPARNPQAASREPRAYTNRDDPFFGLPGHQSPPFDFTLGLLYEESSADARSREVHGLFSGFFQALNEGKGIADFLHPDYRPFLLRNIEHAARGRAEDSPAGPQTGEAPQPASLLKSAIRDFRIGGLAFSESGEMAEAAVLLFGARGRAGGQIVAEKKDTRWYVSGITVAFEDIFVQGEQKDAEAFDPGPSSDMQENLW
jgi:hypothetical protein